MGRRKLAGRHAWIVAAMIAAVGALGAAAQTPTPRLLLPDLDNKPVDVFQNPANTRATVFLFLSVDCPISNRYAPDVRRLYENFSKSGARFWLIYPNPAESTEAIRRHLTAFDYPARALRDPEQALARFTKATVTPEAVVFNGRNLPVYRGRIDDRYVRLGLERPAPTKHDLEEAIAATLAGRTVLTPVTEAVGCFVADFAR